MWILDFNILVNGNIFNDFSNCDNLLQSTCITSSHSENGNYDLKNAGYAIVSAIFSRKGFEPMNKCKLLGISIHRNRCYARKKNAGNLIKTE